MLSFGANKTKICVVKLIKFNCYIDPDLNFRWLGSFLPFRGCRDESHETSLSKTVVIGATGLKGYEVLESPVTS